MSRSVTRRKIETGIIRISEKLRRLPGLISESFILSGIKTVSRSAARERYESYSPQALQKIEISIGVFGDCVELVESLHNLVSKVTVFSESEFARDPSRVISADVDAVLIITNTNQDERFIKRLSSRCDDANTPSCTIYLDEFNDALHLESGEFESKEIPLGIRPHIHNPLPEESVPRGTILYDSSNLLVSSNRGILRKLANPICKSPLNDPALARGFKRQVVLHSSLSDSKSTRAMLSKHLAMGVPLRANYSQSVFNSFPGIETFVSGVPAHYANDLSQAFSKYLNSRLITQAFENGTIYDSLAELLSALIRPSQQFEIWAKRVLVICDDSTAEFKSCVSSQVGVQTTLVSSQGIDSCEFKEIYKTFDYITRMSSSTVYPPDYLASKLCVFKYASVDFVTEPESHFDSTPNQTGNAINPNTTVSRMNGEESLRFFTNGAPILHGRGLFDSNCGSKLFMKLQEYSASASLGSFQLSVIIPIFNNGDYLLTKALPSLLRNDSWNAMEIVLIDDGSTDLETVQICRFLNRLFANVTLFEFSEGGSGSASRARNKGIQIANSVAVTFLDPDNEISDHGYDKLIARFNRANKGRRVCEFVSGYQLKVAENLSTNGRHSFSPWSTQISNPREEFFESGVFPTVSTQAAIMSKQLLIDNDISFVDKAVGQDTLFGWEVLLAAKNPIFTSEARIIYYAERADSVTNNLDVAFFEKSLRREQAQAIWLQENDLMKAYVKRRYDYFIERWYEEKLKAVPNHDRADALAHLRSIAQLYAQTY